MNNRVMMFVLVALTAGAVHAGEPYGTRDFVPSPERPLYFRAGNGEYPGATPPLEWWEGTPVQRDAKDKNGKTIKVWDLSDAKSKNILWKAPVPGWGLSHPIVVGKKVFAVGEPDFVTCYDADTGKVLWQRRMMPLLLDGMPQAKAEAGQKVLDLARAIFYTSGGGASTCGRNPGNVLTYGNGDNPSRQSPEESFARRRDFAAKLVAMIERHRPDVKAFSDADLLAATDKDLDILKCYAGAKDLGDLEGRIKAKGKFQNLEQAWAKKFGVDIGGAWWGYVGSADSTLASDGQRIYGVFDQGQVFALDLDGNLVWGHREKGRQDNRGSFHRSPVLWRDLVLVRSREAKKDTGRMMWAYDAATGKLRWEAPLAGSNYTIPRLMRLPAAGGATVDVLIGDAPQGKDQGQAVLRVADGKLLGCLPKHNCGRGALMGIRGDAVIWTSTSDGGGGPTCCYRLKLISPEAVTAEKVYVLGDGKSRESKAARIFYNQHDFPTMLGDLWLYRGTRPVLYDAIAAQEIARLPSVGKVEAAAVVAGRYLILPCDAGGESNSPGGRRRDDRKAMLRYVAVDLTDSAKPKVISDRNLLGYADPPADIVVKDYLSEFDPYDFAGCYKGAASYFMQMGGPVPHGDRLYNQSTAYLYCIGER